MDLCKLCVQNKAVSTEHLDEFKHATELLQHLFTSFQIQVRTILFVESEQRFK